MSNLSQFIRQNFSNKNWTKDLDVIALTNERIKDIDESFPHLGRNCQLLVLIGFSSIHSRYIEKFQTHIESVFLQALDDENSMVKAIATILINKHNFGYLTFDISMTHDCFGQILQTLLDLDWHYDGSSLNAAFLAPWVQDKQSKNKYKKEKFTDQPFVLKKKKSRAQISKENFLEKLKNVGNRKCSVPLKMRSFRKIDDDEIEIPPPENRPPVRRPINDLATSRAPVRSNSSGLGSDGNIALNRLPGSQLMRYASKKDATIKLISLDELPPVGQRAKQLKKEQMEMERDLKRKEKEDHMREMAQLKEEAKLQKLKERQSIAEARRLEREEQQQQMIEQATMEAFQARPSKPTATVLKAGTPADANSITAQQQIYYNPAAPNSIKPPPATINKTVLSRGSVQNSSLRGDEIVNDDNVSIGLGQSVQLPSISLSATVQEQQQQLLQLQQAKNLNIQQNQKPLIVKQVPVQRQPQLAPAQDTHSQQSTQNIQPQSSQSLMQIQQQASNQTQQQQQRLVAVQLQGQGQSAGQMRTVYLPASQFGTIVSGTNQQNLIAQPASSNPTVRTSAPTIVYRQPQAATSSAGPNQLGQSQQIILSRSDSGTGQLVSGLQQQAPVIIAQRPSILQTNQTPGVLQNQIQIQPQGNSQQQTFRLRAFVQPQQQQPQQQSMEQSGTAQNNVQQPQVIQMRAIRPQNIQQQVQFHTTQPIQPQQIRPQQQQTISTAIRVAPQNTSQPVSANQVPSVNAANSNAGDSAVLQTGLSLTRDQMLNVQNIFRDANKVTRPHKAIILSFMAGSRANPNPTLGNQVRIHLSQYREVVQDPVTGQPIEVQADTYFQMDYTTGEWDTKKYYTRAGADQLINLPLAPSMSHSQTSAIG